MSSDREEFERELERYLAQRRKSRAGIAQLLNVLKPRKKMPDKAELPSDVQPYDEEQENPEEKPELAEEEKKSDKNVLKSILEKIGLVAKEGVEEEEKAQELIAQDETKEDFKEVAKITLAVIKQLPSEQMRAFKNSPDFERLKTILKKHNLIK